MLPAASVNDAGWPWTEESPQLADVMPNGQSWPKISIVTPVLNGEAFIEQTIRSVLLQGYPNYEFLILDGGSTDGTLGIIEKYSPWLQCISEKDNGQSAAINRGFRLADGELIGWQNADDLYGRDSFREAAIAVVEYPDYEIYHGTVSVFADTNFQPPWLDEICEEFSQESLFDRMCMMNTSMFFRRTVFDHGVFLNEDLHYTMDVDYFWQLSLAGFRYKLVRSMTGYFRWHVESKSARNNGKSDLEGYGLLKRLCHDERLSVALRRKARAYLRKDFLRSFRYARRNLLKKIVRELIMPV